MPRYECLASFTREWNKLSWHRSIEAASATDAMGVFGQFVGEQYKNQTDSLGDHGRRAFGLLPVTTEDVDSFVHELVRAASRLRRGEDAVRFVGTCADLGKDAAFFVHLWTSDRLE